MKLSLKKFTSLLFVSFFLIFLNSCSKDSDLLSEYVVQNPDSSSSLDNRVFDDTFFIQNNNAIILDVLQNDLFDNLNNVRIVETSLPTSGTIVINADNTLTYTPQTVVEEPTDNSTNESIPDTTNEDKSTESEPATEESTESSEAETDTFIYVAEETNEDGVVTTEEGSVTISNAENKNPTSGENVYYVTTSGKSNSSGKSEANAWDISHAFKAAKAGDIIYIKAGNYGGGNYTFNQSGSAGREIKFIGYKNSPGDIDASTQNLLSNETRDRRGSTQYANNVAFDYQNTPDYTQMPYFNKSYIRDDIFFTITGDYIEFHNIIVKGGDIGLLYNSTSSNCKLINSILVEQGRMDIAQTDKSNPDRFHGTGVANRRSTNLMVKYCSFLNCEQQALEIRGANSGTYSDNVVYSYNTINGTDYFYLVTSDSGIPSQNLVIEYNRCHRLSNVRHGGHGFITKNGAINNTFRNWNVINSNIETSYANANNNLFEKGKIQGSFSTTGDALTYLLTSNGSSGNTFKDIIIDDVWGGLVFLDHGEDSSSPYAGRANDYINIIVKNATYGVIFSESSSNLGPTNDNRFLNCTFYNVDNGIRAYRNNSNNEFINCHFSASKELYTNHAGFTLNNNTKFENCHFSGNINANSASSFADVNNISGDPLFQDTSTLLNNVTSIGGLQLSPESPLIGMGQNTSLLNSKCSTDFYGRERVTYNIGAF
ncbi:Ig-like domain-containing protein [Maribacter hydrothermalis]|uniref:Right handed beta helix region n=1 Tax=Maribacter hydrothermalis TaxID=1836467 RepID=A0A1B7ZD64_9FLAO|nr:Ig-like domain-containing protein [Maribacter hydrothermalis]APQ18513.1 hypothetical protein BTR34_14840 [Maribacter hydrothermalis]OBR41280.1 hypothetical protein A9200_13255 [Maribacter hydrothermalis]